MVWFLLCGLTSCSSFREAANKLRMRMDVKKGQNETHLEWGLLPDQDPLSEDFKGFPPFDVTVDK
jgi:hypothetical protein